MSLLFSRREGLYKLKVNGNDDGPSSIQLLKLTSGKFIYGVDYDFNDNKIFWTERDDSLVRESSGVY